MAEEVLYSSGGDSNKRKYEDSPSRTPMAKGFSSPPDSAAKQASYNNVPPPMNEFELAKQKAQEIAARLLSNADPSKRARVESGGAGGGGFSSSDNGAQRSSGFGFNASPQVASSGYPGLSTKIEIPNGRVGVIIGKGGDTIKYLQLQSGAKIQVTRDMDADPNSTTRVVELMGTPEQIAKAEQLISDVLSEAEAGASAGGSRRMTGTQSGAEQFVMKIPNNKVGLVIGKGGETIKNMQASTGARIQVIPLHLPPGDMSKERTVQIDGTSEQIEAAKLLVEEVISENRARNQSMAGGYSQQGYQARLPPNWGQPGPPMQQPGYGYAQPGAYPGPPPPYSQPQYSGYPQQPNSGGYSASWDQSTTPHNQQASAQGGGYDYYNQQPPQQQHLGGPGASADNSGYSYGQVPPYSQGQSYGQDGYGYPTAQTGYGQPPSNTGHGYDQQQQGYNTYGSAPNPNSDGNASYGAQSEASQAPAAVPTPGQPYNAGGQPVSNTNYPPQASAQPGYGAPPSSQGGYAAQTPSPYGSYGPPPGQKPPAVQPAYAQPQQSPGVQGSYSQAGYPQSQQPAAQPTYAQPDSSAQRPPSSGYQTSYGAPPPYGAPPANQPNYGQQPPPQYNTAYAAGYSQPPAYPSDGSAGSNARGGYDATPPSQTAQPSAAAKASPPS